MRFVKVFRIRFNNARDLSRKSGRCVIHVVRMVPGGVNYLCFPIIMVPRHGIITCGTMHGGRGIMVGESYVGYRKKARRRRHRGRRGSNYYSTKKVLLQGLRQLHLY